MKDGREWSGGTPLFSVTHFGFFVHLLLCFFVLRSCGFGEWNFGGKSQEVSAIHFLFSLCEDLLLAESLSVFKGMFLFKSML